MLRHTKELKGGALGHFDFPIRCFLLCNFIPLDIGISVSLSVPVDSGYDELDDCLIK